MPRTPRLDRLGEETDDAFAGSAAECPRPPGGPGPRWRWRGVYSTLPPSNPIMATNPSFASSKQKSAV